MSTTKPVAKTILCAWRIRIKIKEDLRRMAYERRTTMGKVIEQLVEAAK